MKIKLDKNIKLMILNLTSEQSPLFKQPVQVLWIIYAKLIIEFYVGTNKLMLVI